MKPPFGPADPQINERITAVDPSLGCRLLLVDNAVWKVLSERLGVTGTREEVRGRATLAARIRQVGDDPLSFRVVAEAPGAGDGTMVTIDVNGPGVLAPSGDGLVTTNDVARWRWGSSPKAALPSSPPPGPTPGRAPGSW